MPQWYFAYGNQQYGPMDDAQACSWAATNPAGHAWREGMSEWLPIPSIPELVGAHRPRSQHLLSPPRHQPRP